jgi:hypothetical protein
MLSFCINPHYTIGKIFFITLKNSVERFVLIRFKINDSRLCRKLLPGYGNKTNVPCLPNAPSARLKLKKIYLKNIYLHLLRKMSSLKRTF